MGKKIKVMTVFGTRPEAIKMAPVVLELKKYADIEPIVTVTAQHREMLDQVLELFKIKPNHDLDIMAAGQTLFDITAKALNGLNVALAESRKCWRRKSRMWSWCMGIPPQPSLLLWPASTSRSRWVMWRRGLEPTTNIPRSPKK